ncbi:MAG: hypothetical protein JSS51_07865 [Planctomycetes bacterium]|nr:hypothetical protein [Planctomycetota bacterium]
MEWQVRLTPKAREQWISLDPGLRDEVGLQVIEMCDDPFSLLRRSGAMGEPPGYWILECATTLDIALRIRLFFDEVREEGELTLVMIASFRESDEDRQ